MNLLIFICFTLVGFVFLAAIGMHIYSLIRDGYENVSNSILRPITALVVAIGYFYLAYRFAALVLQA